MWIEIFKAGTHTDSGGHTVEYSPESIAKIADIYNSKVSDDGSNLAPLVKGHPKSNDPALGWVARLGRRGSSLFARLKNLTPDIIEDVRLGRFKKVSIALYPDMMLRHVGLLGAAAPAVKGLQPLAFNDDNPFVEYDLDYTQSAIQELNPVHNIGQDEPEQQYIESAESRIAELERLLEESKQKIYYMEKEGRLKEYREFTNNLLSNLENSPITPALADELIDILEMAYQSDYHRNNDISFTESESNLTKVKNFISKLKPMPGIGEFAVKSRTFNMETDKLQNRNLQPEKLEMHERAREIQYSTPGLSYEEAICIAAKEYF